MVAHLFWDTAEHLVKSMSALVNDPDRYCIYLGSSASIKIESRLKEDENRGWISKLTPGVYRGGLESAWWWCLRKLKSRLLIFVLNVLSQVLLPEFSFSALCKIARGPKCWVIHGGYLNFPTMLVFKLMGKKVDYIHWGGHVHFWRYASFFSKLACRMCNRIYVLMTPERRWFIPYKGDRVEVLSYPSDFMEQCSPDMMPGWRTSGAIPRGMMLGNNVWRRDKYPEILDKLNPAEWDKVVCMLNYGLEGSEAETQRFIEKYRARFGDAFYPWVGTVSYDEYAKIMAACPFYVCPENQQTGLGAIYLGAYQGRGLLLRGDNLEWCREVGLKVTDIDSIEDFSYKYLCQSVPTDAELKMTHDCLKKYFVEDNTRGNWCKRIDDSFQGLS